MPYGKAMNGNTPEEYIKGEGKKERKRHITLRRQAGKIICKAYLGRKRDTW